MKPWLVAHRGAPHHAQENTVEAFRIARSFDVGYIEFDVRITADNKAIVHHDPTIAKREIAKTMLSELKKIDPLLTSLHQAIQICEDTATIIELKSFGCAEHVAPYLLKNPKISATSFYVSELEHLASLGIPKNRLYMAQRRHAIGLYKKIKIHGFGGISVNAWYLNPWLYRRAIQNDLNILTYTVNQPLWAKLIRKWFPETLICTDRPDKLGSLS